MFLVMKILVYLLFGLDTVIYKMFGVVTPIRRAIWSYEAKRLQKALDYQRVFVSEHNACHYIDHSGKYYVDNYRMVDSVDVINSVY